MSQKYIKTRNNNRQNKAYNKYFAQAVYDAKFVESDLRKTWSDLRSDSPLPNPREDARLWTALAVSMARMECGPKRITLAVEKSAAEGYRLLYE